MSQLYSRTMRVAAFAWLGVAGALGAQTGVTTRDPFEITPMFGYRLEGTLDSGDGATPAVSLQDHATFGINFGYWLDPNGSLEIQYSRTPTQMVSSATVTLPSQTLDVTLQDIQFAGIAHFRVSNPHIRPFIGMGIGVTIFDPSGGFTGTTRFSFSLFGGVKWYFNDHVGLRFEARWIPVYLGSGESGFWCVWLGGQGACHLTSQVSLLEQGDFRTGLILRF